MDERDPGLEEAMAGLRRGDFSLLAPLFKAPRGREPRILTWAEQGQLPLDPVAFNEALSCACFLGATPVAERLLELGAGIQEGNGTGLNGFHWAANRGQLETVRMLIQRRAPLETENSYGGTVLGGTVWAAVHEPKPDHLLVIEALLKAGADILRAEYPSGRADVDRVLERFGVGK